MGPNKKGKCAKKQNNNFLVLVLFKSITVIKVNDFVLVISRRFE